MKTIYYFLCGGIFFSLFTGCGMTFVKSDDLARLQTEKSNLNEMNLNLQSGLRSKNEEIESLSNRLTSLNNLVDSTKQGLGNQIELLKVRSSILSNENLNLQSDLQSKNEEIGLLSNDLINLNSMIDSVKQSLSDQIESLKAGNSNLSAENESILADLSLQKKLVSSLQDERDNLQKLSDSNSMQITSLKNLVDSTKGSLGNQIDRLTSYIKERDEVIVSLNQQISNRDYDIISLRKNISDLSAEREKILTEKDLEISNLAMTSSNISKQMQSEIDAGNLKIQQMGDELNIDFKDKIFFDLGSADIRNNGKKVLDDLIKVLKYITNKQIRVEGYTDNVPIADQYKWKFPSNWELSTARATTIVRYLQSKGIDPSLLKATGYGEYNPIVPNDSEAHRAQNRRIVVLLVPLDERARFK